MKNLFLKVKPYFNLINFFSLLSILFAILAMIYILIGQSGTGLILLFGSLLAQVGSIDLRMARLEKETVKHRILVSKFITLLFKTDEKEGD